MTGDVRAIAVLAAIAAPGTVPARCSRPPCRPASARCPTGRCADRGRRARRTRTPLRSAAACRPTSAYAATSSKATWTTGWSPLAVEAAAGPLRMLPVRARRVAPPLQRIVERHRRRRGREDGGAGHQLVARHAGKVLGIERALGDGHVAGRRHEPLELARSSPACGPSRSRRPRRDAPAARPACRSSRSPSRRCRRGPRPSLRAPDLEPGWCRSARRPHRARSRWQRQTTTRTSRPEPPPEPSLPIHGRHAHQAPADGRCSRPRSRPARQWPPPTGPSEGNGSGGPAASISRSRANRYPILPARWHLPARWQPARWQRAVGISAMHAPTRVAVRA